MDFFKSGIFQGSDTDYDLAIGEFYKRFDTSLNQQPFHETGVHIDRIIREPYVIAAGEASENKTTVYFHFLKNPGTEFSFVLWGEMEEQPFFNMSKDELLDFFEVRFRRFSKLLNR